MPVNSPADGAARAIGSPSYGPYAAAVAGIATPAHEGQTMSQRFREQRRGRRGLQALALLAAVAAAPTPAAGPGKDVYDFYCYQCHGYAGDGRTLAARNLSPPPRDFTAADPERLTRERMLAAVTEGRPGTGMVSFAAVLSAEERAAVVDYVRQAFMSDAPREGRYHTAANGWPDHDRYRAAYPFATGEIPLDAPAGELTAQQQRGRAMYFDACITCHDQPARESSEPIWDPRPVSYPRGDYSHRAPDAVSEASYYAAHDRRPALPADAGADVLRGEQLFQDNCAFCHGADGSGRNWIGDFMEPKARDLAEPGVVAGRSDAALRTMILEGVNGSFMPAWRHVLEPHQVDDLMAYLRVVFDGPESTTANRGPP